jgi:hypothetical protein
MSKTNYFGKALAIAMMLLGLTFVSCDEQDNPVPSAWDGVTPNLPLTLEAVAEDGTMNVTFISTLPETTTIEYSIDGGRSWRVFTISGGKPAYDYGGDPDIPGTWQNQAETPASRTISSVHQILIKGENASYGSGEKGDLRDDCRSENVYRYLNIKVNADCYIYGNAMSLIGGDDFATKTELSGKYNFYRMFDGNTNLKNHSSKKLLLPATTLTKNCYNGMFSGCTALTTAPELPATTLADSCYNNMFTMCFALENAPALPATSLAKGCYEGMFTGCTAMTTAPVLPATIMADRCYASMFNGAGIKAAPALPATTLAKGCYNFMFGWCNSLTEASDLPATTLADDCYNYMYACTPITKAPTLSATKLAKNCCAYMFFMCMSLTTAPEELPATTLEYGCYNSMFYYCTSLVKAPALPATTLAEGCYANMFNSCYALTTAPALPATTLTEGCYAHMFSDCTALETGPTLPAEELKTQCYVGMFSGCIKLNKVTCLATSIEPGAWMMTNDWMDDAGKNVAGAKNFYKDSSVNVGWGEFWSDDEHGVPETALGWTATDAN